MKMIKSAFLSLLILLASIQPAVAALSTGTQFQIQATATANFVNGAGFNAANTGYLTNLTATSATGGSPVVSSASYNFAAGDVGAWIYIAGGTNWIVGWYQIASVASNAATVNAGIGQAITAIDPLGTVTYNSTAGIATTASPTGGDGMVDYSQQASAQITGTDGTSLTTGTTFTALLETFTPVMVGNLLHITACTGTGCSTGWYEIATYIDSHDVTLDRNPTNGVNAITASTFYVGGAGNFGALENTFQSIIPAKAIVWIQNGNYTLSSSISTANTNCVNGSSCSWIGFTSVRGDTTVGANRPVFIAGNNAVTFSQLQNFFNISFTITNGNGITPGVASILNNDKFYNSSATAASIALRSSGSDIAVSNSEIISLNGYCLYTTSDSIAVFGSYLHDCTYGYYNQSPNQSFTVIGNIFEANTTADFYMPTGSQFSANFEDNIFYGNENKLGIGLDFGKSNQAGVFANNNIFYGLSTGILVTTGSGANYGLNNDYFNNTTDVTNWYKSPTSLALAPLFANETTLVNTGTVTGSTTTLTDTGAGFGVTNNVDILHVTAISGSGCLTGGYMITNHTTTTLTLNNSLGGASCTAITYFIQHGHNFAIGNSGLKNSGFPSLTNATGTNTTSYPAIGAVQPNSAGSAGVVGYGTP